MLPRAGDTPLLFIAREGHYKYPPAEIPALLIQSGANMEAKDSAGRTALQVRSMQPACVLKHVKPSNVITGLLIHAGQV
jgi:hypothetical protein